MGDRTPNDEVSYPTEDLQAVMDENGKWRFAHKNGQFY
jgi:hypothetical protein